MPYGAPKLTLDESSGPVCVISKIVALPAIMYWDGDPRGRNPEE